jgi:hypothetical protein
MKKIILALCCIQLGCATMFSSDQTIPIVTDPEGATIKVYNKDEEEVFTGTTPCSITLPKKDLVQGRVIISKAGYRDTEIFLGDATEPWVFANVCCLAGFFVGAGFDYLKDNHRKTEVEQVNIDLYSRNALLYKENSNCVIVENIEDTRILYLMDIVQDSGYMTIRFKEL